MLSLYGEEEIVKAKVSSKSLYEGDELTYFIECRGEDVKFPTIKEIDGVKVKRSWVNRGINYKKGTKTEKKITKKYRLYPHSSVTIPSYKVTVDSKEYETKPIRVEVKKRDIDKKGAISLSYKIDKSEAFVGEPIYLRYTFRHLTSLKLSEVNFHPPSFKGFWVKKSKKTPTKTDGNHTYYNMDFILFPQREGELRVGEGVMDVGVLQSQKRGYYSFRRVLWRKVKTKPITLHIKPLPSGVDIYGDYSFSVVVDKNKTKANEPVNLTVTISGEGSADDMEPFELDIPQATVYSDKPKRFSEFKDGKSIVLFKQKFAIVSDRNFTIKPFNFRFFDARTKKIKSLSSREFNIEVIGSKDKEIVLIKPKTEESKPFWKGNIGVIFGAGLFLFGGFIGYLLRGFTLKKRQSRKNFTLKERIAKTKNDKELLKTLLPFIGRSKKIDTVIKDLEMSVYNGKESKIRKRDILNKIDNLLEDDKEMEILR
jgi:hypothetical protein